MSATRGQLGSRIEIGLLGAVLFWGPRLIGHIVWASRFTRREVFILTILLPVLTLAGLWIASKVRTTLAVDGLGSLWAVGGIWITGPIFMTTGWALAQGRDLDVPGWILVILGTALFPIFTFMMSVYDGTLGALAVTTSALFFRAFLVWPRRLQSPNTVQNP